SDFGIRVIGHVDRTEGYSRSAAADRFRCRDRPCIARGPDTGSIDPPVAAGKRMPRPKPELVFAELPLLPAELSANWPERGLRETSPNPQPASRTQPVPDGLDR